MNTEIVQTMQDGAKALATDDAVLRASTIAVTIDAQYRIKNTDDNDTATGDRRALKDGIKRIDDGLKAMFAPYEELAERIRGQWRVRKDALKRAVEVIDRQKIEFDNAERRRREQERIEAQRQAEAAAKQAAAEAAEAARDEEVPGPAQIVIPEARPPISRMGEAKSVIRETPQAELVDALACAKEWPHVLRLDSAGALAEFRALLNRGQVEKASEAGTIIGGVRFYAKRSVSG